MNQLILGYPTNDRNKILSIDPKSLLHHTLIVGQSGSGKSFLVARLLEEILLHTRARILVLDPNGDFRDFGRLSSALSSERLSDLEHFYSIAKRDGHETFDKIDEFERAWSLILRAHLSTDKADRRQSTESAYFGPLRLNWDNLADEQDVLLATDPSLHAKTLLGLKACREYLEWVNTERPEVSPPMTVRGLIIIAERFANQDINLDHYQYVKSLLREHWEAVQALLHDLLTRHAALWYAPQGKYSVPMAPPDVCDFIDVAFEEEKDVSTHPWETLLLGLDSAAPADARLVADVALWRLWTNAKAARSSAIRASSAEGSDQPNSPAESRQRRPIFIVVDEAHNFAPTETTDRLTRRVTERLIQVASEGRKYGLYLILATQRPTKLHQGLVAECENQCVLRIQASLEHDFTSRVLGIPIERARNAALFTTGQALVSGRWVSGSEVKEIMILPARTSVGGDGLGDDWAVSPDRSERTIKVPGNVKVAAAVVTTPSAIKQTLERHIQSFLNDASEPVQLEVLAQHVDQLTHGDGSATGWGGTGTFAQLLRGMQALTKVRVKIEGTRGWAYLEGIHDPSQAQGIGGAVGLAAKGVPPGLERFAAETELPRLASSVYALLFTWIAEATDGAPFSLTQVSKLIRDKAVALGHPVSRQDASFVMRGLLAQGHVFAPDVTKTATELAESFFQSAVVLGQRRGVPLTPIEREKLRSWIVGDLVPPAGEPRIGEPEQTNALPEATFGEKDDSEPTGTDGR